jgi:hypothetical protein
MSDTVVIFRGANITDATASADTRFRLHVQYQGHEVIVAAPVVPPLLDPDAPGMLPKFIEGLAHVMLEALETPGAIHHAFPAPD